MREAAVASFVKQNEIKALSCETLRFCWTCLRGGFHSALYQLLVLKECLVHEEQFITACVNCGKEISYRLNITSFRNPYCCPNYNQPLSLITKKNREVMSEKSTFRDQKLGVIAKWLIYRLETETIDRVIQRNGRNDSPEFNVLQSGRESTDDVISNLSDYWLDAFSSSNSSNRLRKILGKRRALEKAARVGF